MDGEPIELIGPVVEDKNVNEETQERGQVELNQKMFRAGTMQEVNMIGSQVENGYNHTMNTLTSSLGKDLI